MKNILHYRYHNFLILLLLLVQLGSTQAKDIINIQYFLNLATGTIEQQQAALNVIDKEWSKQYETSYTTMILEVMSFVRSRTMYLELNSLLNNKTSQNINFDQNAWFKWVWSLPYKPHPNYAEFKSQLYKNIDPIFSQYFDQQVKSSIRLDEIRWGGVRQDGIPPLRQPKMISANTASYLKDSDIVFGIEVNNDVRAYPKRILAWHEMFIDQVGGIAIAGVYCTLCGTVIIYDTKTENQNHKIGTSGFLYRSNKLMYDRKTLSLWSTFTGAPVVGPLVATGLKLGHRYVVTTTWGEWKKRHPQTQVLALDTGYTRNYDEGAAYQDYFSTDELMFNVPKLDTRLKNKDEILGLIFNESPTFPLAISVNYLAKNPIYHDKLATQDFLALTDKSGAIRVYANKGLKFVQWDQKNTVIDELGVKWNLSESSLKSTNGKTLYRLPTNRAFWFGWFSAYSNTRLIK